MADHEFLYGWDLSGIISQGNSISSAFNDLPVGRRISLETPIRAMEAGLKKESRDDKFISELALSTIFYLHL